MFVLITIGVLVSLFAFTLGVHFGKKVGRLDVISPDSSTGLADIAPDQVPDRTDIAEQMAGVQNTVDDLLNRNLQEEVARTGIKIDKPLPVSIPEKTKSPTQGATQLNSETIAMKEEVGQLGGEYTIQVGSFPALEEAREKQKTLESSGLQAFFHEAVIQGRGTWYRVFVGGFRNYQEADTRAKRLKADQKIGDYVISKMPTRD